jgi:predicted enzyme related to lactoylglutathione lyase
VSKVGLIVYSVSDVEKATKVFTTWLGTEPYAQSPYYVGFRTGDIEIGLNPNGARSGITGALAYADVDDINAALAALVAAGAEKVQDPTDVANGLLVAVVRDPDGTPIGLRQAPKS